ncbi:hypothetical protein ACH4TV_44710 [Streptomyces sp. NPDC020898]|uniref:hypothetical protein n=1 Tax=Streptomyces sp. NPDC020898 TaxID=3365101 RepID=UPI0037B7318B
MSISAVLFSATVAALVHLLMPARVRNSLLVPAFHEPDLAQTPDDRHLVACCQVRFEDLENEAPNEEYTITMLDDLIENSATRDIQSVCA